MDRISFPRPDDAVMDWWDEHDRNNFMARRLPEAIMKMRQGAGRLIRSVSDRGVVVILDPRMRTKGYGRTILRSLPSCGFSQDIEDVGRFLGGNA
jgi:ATP-dependent DNA helicase DinG